MKAIPGKLHVTGGWAVMQRIYHIMIADELIELIGKIISSLD